MTTLDEKALEKAAKALCIALGSACPVPMYSDHHAVAAKIIEAYLSALIPEDVAEVILGLNLFQEITLGDNPSQSAPLCNGSVRDMLAEMRRAATALQALVVERDYWNAEARRLSGGLLAINAAATSVPAEVLRGIAYDVALNCIKPDVAEFQIERRAATIKAEGMVLVPREPTDEMITAAAFAGPERYEPEGTSAAIWRAMIAAAPDRLVKVESGKAKG